MHGDFFVLSIFLPLDCSFDAYFILGTTFAGGYGKIISWNVNSWRRVGSKSIGREGISAFNVSSDGKFLAM